MAALLSKFPLKERLLLSYYHYLQRLQQKVPKALRRSYDLVRDLQRQNCGVSIKDGQIQFTSEINGQDRTFELDLYSSDPGIFKQVFLEAEYHALVKLCQNAGFSPERMIDAGANIGLVSIYLTAFFPNMEVVALEPNARNRSLLKHHLTRNKLTNVKVKPVGLWSHATQLCADYTFRGGQDASFRLREAQSGEKGTLETKDIAAIMKEQAWPQIDFLKIDIEGGETAVFGPKANLNWLTKTRMLAIEIHDEFNCRDHIEGLLRDYGFQLDHSGELTLAWQ